MDIVIVRQTDNKTVAYACPACGILYSILHDNEAGQTAAREAAKACCPARTCPQCNQRPAERGAPACEVCAISNSKAIEGQRFANAPKVSEAQWSGPIYWPGAPFTGDHGGFYWSSVASLRKDIAERNGRRVDVSQLPVTLPAYVYATKPIAFKPDATAMIEAALVDHSDTVVIDAAQVQLLQKTIDEWATKQQVQSYEEDLGKAIVLA